MNVAFRFGLGAAAVAVVMWIALVAVLVRFRPQGISPSEAKQFVPDMARLIKALARDRSVPRGVRVRLWLLLGYLASPVDLVPDFIPVLGYADDVVMAALVLRSALRRAGGDALARHWGGSEQGLALVRRLTGTP